MAVEEMDHSGPPKRKRGRPPKKKEENNPLRRKRGQPRKHANTPILEHEDLEDANNSLPIDATPRRGPGRPRKEPQSVPRDPDEEYEEVESESEASSLGEGLALTEDNGGNATGSRLVGGNTEWYSDSQDPPVIRPRSSNKTRGRPRKEQPEESRRRKTRNSLHRHHVVANSGDADGTHDDDVDEPLAKGDDLWAPVGRAEANICLEVRNSYLNRTEVISKKARNKPRITKEYIDRKASSFYRFDTKSKRIWTFTDEAALAEEWDNSAEKQALDLLHNRGAQLSSVFKLCFELFKIDPPSLLSLYRDFRYDSSGNNAIQHKDKSMSNPLWSPTFCDKLVSVMVHPLFRTRGASRLIPLKAIWAVLLRSDDAAGFDPEETAILEHVGCPSLGILPEGKGLRERFKEQRCQEKRTCSETTRYTEDKCSSNDFVLLHRYSGSFPTFGMSVSISSPCHEVGDGGNAWRKLTRDIWKIVSNQLTIFR